MNSDGDVFNYLSRFDFDDKSAINTLMDLYPNDPPNDVPITHTTPSGADLGLQFKRLATLSTDYIFSAPRRLAANIWAQNATSPFYSYRFNTVPAGVAEHYGATHHQELAFVLYNTLGIGFFNLSQPMDGPNPFGGKPQSYKDLAALMSGAWISFIADGTPTILNKSLPGWPAYYEGPGGQSGTNYVFDAEAGSHLEDDTFRHEGIQFMSDHFRAGDGPFGRYSD